ncbi:MAG: heavy metal translocating P-type ATPase [Cyanobacteriota bacterium]|nr:heavy metal translocating P-type ATPase [Cyanobacteriota bacterium]
MLSSQRKTQRFQISGMDCGSCAAKIEDAIQKLAGVSQVSVSFATERMQVGYDPTQVSEAAIQERIQSLGYRVTDPEDLVRASVPQHSHDHQSHDHNDEDHGHSRGDPEAFSLKQEIAVVVGVVVLFLVGFIFEDPLHNTPYSIAEYLVFIPAYLLSGWGVLYSAIRNLYRGRVFDENFLMSIATLGGIAVHKLPEAVAVMLFYRIGELFQEAAVNRSRRSIKALLEVRPDYANLQTATGIQKVAPDTVQVGQIISVNPGEKIPLDGDVISGHSFLDTSALTGESVPREVQPGETVSAGMINQSGVITIKVSKLFGESSISKILSLVENATTRKAETEKFISQFARIYTPIVVTLAVAVAIVPTLLIPGAIFSEWVYRALILLVISCPCGLVISIPLGYFGGIGAAAKRGILVKGSTFLDVLTQVKTVVFDKTGTLTKGNFIVTQIIPYQGFDRDKLLRIAAQAEASSNHPVAKSIRAAYGQPVDPSLNGSYQEIPGHGIRTWIDGLVVLAGNDRLLHREGIPHDTCKREGTVVHIAIGAQYAGYILIADELKSDAAQAIRDLKAVGVEKTVMLTGDNQLTAKQVAATLGLDEVRADLLPEGKVAALEEILKAADPNSKTVFVGDGINDAPVIARADVGIAMGGLGSDAAIETADVVIMTDAPSKVAEAIRVSRKTRHIVVQNIVLAMTVKGLFILLGSFGLASLWEAIFADVGVALLAILNAARVMK